MEFDMSVAPHFIDYVHVLLTLLILLLNVSEINRVTSFPLNKKQ